MRCGKTFYQSSKISFTQSLCSDGQPLKTNQQGCVLTHRFLTLFALLQSLSLHFLSPTPSASTLPECRCEIGNCAPEHKASISHFAQRKWRRITVKGFLVAFSLLTSCPYMYTLSTCNHHSNALASPVRSQQQASAAEFELRWNRQAR
jgi:hypothetical protein